MANVVTALSVSSLEDASTGQWPMQMLICGHLGAVSEMRVGPQHRWLGTSDCLCIQIWWVDTPEHRHWTQASDCAGNPPTPCLLPLVFQHGRLTLRSSRWRPGSQREL